MNRFDILILIIVFLYGLRGMIRGVLTELMDVCIVIASVVVSVLYVGAFTAWFSRVTHTPIALALMIAFFVIYWLTANLLRLVVRFLYEPKKVSFLKRIWGAVIGLMRGILAAGIFAFLVSNFLAPQKPHWEKEKSVLVKPVGSIAPAVYQSFTTVFPRSKSVFDQMEEGFLYCADRIRDRIHPPFMEK
jgi:membrane protein required for colicin V production